MIKRMGFVRRKDGMSHDDFVSHWLNVHAPLAAKAPGLRRYIVSPTLYQDGLPATRKLELLTAQPLSNGAVALHYRRAH